MPTLMPTKLLAIALVLMGSVISRAADNVDYMEVIKPLLAEKCAACHGTLKQEAGLRLDHGDWIRKGGDSGPVIDDHQSDHSELLRRVATDDLSIRMPPEHEGEPLTAAQLAALQTWLAKGAPSPADEPLPVSPEQHWAWQIIERPEVPKLTNDQSTSNPIDAFVLEQLAARGLEPAAPTDPRTALRRACFDLVGLPPSPQQQEAFLADASEEAWATLVDQILDDPAHGQRWARHWMDVWRYSDWDGYKNELRGSQRHIWRWRDWIVESLNADKGYDQMILEMLAADELRPDDTSALRATGFLARNFHKSNRDIWLDATVEHTAKAFLATTINCARCHDHKYDPIEQREYYAFRAIFEPHQVRTERVAGQSDLAKDGLVRVYDAKPEEPTFLYVAGNEKQPDKSAPVAPGVPALLSDALQTEPIELPPVAVFPVLRPFVEQEELAIAEQALAVAKKELATQTQVNSAQAATDDAAFEVARQTVATKAAALHSLRARWSADKLRYANSKGNQDSQQAAVQAAAKAEHQVNLETAKLRLLTSHQQLSQLQLTGDEPSPESSAQAPAAEKVEKAKKEVQAAEQALAALEKKQPDLTAYTSVGKAYPDHSSGRRAALARWIVRPDNPLTARVAVNYVWMRYFGEPLVANVFDFGLRSPEPVHRKLLDWLAAELLEHQWSLKHLHRLIVNSRVYRASSSEATPGEWATNRGLDLDNRLLWRANVRRLDAEVVRDSLLHVAGNLNISHGGPDIDFREGETVPRRSLYFRHAYEKQMTMLVLFDVAAPTECYRRSESVVPQQALALANSPLSFDQARLLAGQLSKTIQQLNSNSPSEADDAFIRAAFAALLCRECSLDELGACREFLSQQTRLLAEKQTLTPLPGRATATTPPNADPAQRARENLIHTLFNHNDFITLR